MRCPLFAQCGWQRQKRPADVWFVAHECLMHQKPAVLGKVVELLLDEDPLDAFTPDPEEIGFEEFGRESTITDDEDRRADPHFHHVTLGRKLTLARRALLHVLEDLRDGPVPKAALLDFVSPPRRGGQGGLGWDPSKQIRREWREKAGADITPTMAREEVEATALGARGNALLDKRVKLWRLVAAGVEDAAPNLSGRLALKTQADGKRMVVMRGITKIAAAWGTPAGVADATANPDLLQYVLQGLPTNPVLFANMPHARFHQLVDRSFGKMTIGVEGMQLESEHIEDRKRTAARMWAALLADATRRYGGQATVVVTYKSSEEYIREELYVPQWVTLAHFGGVSGHRPMEGGAGVVHRRAAAAARRRHGRHGRCLDRGARGATRLCRGGSGDLHPSRPGRVHLGACQAVAASARGRRGAAAEGVRGRSAAGGRAGARAMAERTQSGGCPPLDRRAAARFPGTDPNPLRPR